MTGHGFQVIITICKPYESFLDNAKSPTKNEEERIVKARVQAALEKVRPSLQADGGDVKLVEVTDDGIVRVQLQGHCAGCPMSMMTLKNGIERILKEEIPEVKTVESV